MFQDTCQREGHQNQPITSIFINEKPHPIYGVERFGCAQCVCERHGDRTLSLTTAMNVPKYTSLFNFPCLDKNTRADVEKQIEITNNLSYNEEINELFDALEYELKQIFIAKQEEAKKLTQDIKQMGEYLREEYRRITNCDRIKEIYVSTSEWDDLNTQMEEVIQNLYNSQTANDKSINDKTLLYIQRLATFQMEYLNNLKKKMIDALSKISFEKSNSSSSVQVQKQVLDFSQYVKKAKRQQQSNSQSICPSSSLEFLNSDPSEKFKKLLKPFAIENNEEYSLLQYNDNPPKNFCNQAVSTPLNPMLTYHVTFELISCLKDKPFTIGIGDCSKSCDVLYGDTNFFKVFQPAKPLEKGCIFVEYGSDLSTIANLEGHKIIMKFNISKNYIKFQNQGKESSNCQETNDELNQDIKYCLYIINQSPQFSVRITSVIS